MKLADIAGYQYSAEQFCPSCILDKLPTGQGERFDGWADFSRQPVEASLDELAFAFGIERGDESTFDSDDFPKAILGQHVSSNDVWECDECGTDLTEY